VHPTDGVPPMLAAAFRHWRSQRGPLPSSWISEAAWRSALLGRDADCGPPESTHTFPSGLPRDANGVPHCRWPCLLPSPNTGWEHSCWGSGHPLVHRREARAASTVCQPQGMPAASPGLGRYDQGRLRVATGAAQRHFAAAPTGLDAPLAPGIGEAVPQRARDLQPGVTSPRTQDYQSQSQAYIQSEPLSSGPSPSVQESQLPVGGPRPSPLHHLGRAGALAKCGSAEPRLARWEEARPTPVRPRLPDSTQAGGSPG